MRSLRILSGPMGAPPRQGKAAFKSTVLAMTAAAVSYAVNETEAILDLPGRRSEPVTAGTDGRAGAASVAFGRDSMLIRIALSAALLTTVSSCGCEDGACISEVTAHVTTSLDSAGLRQATVSICRNAFCLEGSAAAPVGDAGVEAFFLNGGSATGANVSFGAGGAIDIVYHVSTSADLQDGDRYVITVTDKDGAVVGSVDETVDYDPSAASSCGPVCRHATL